MSQHPYGFFNGGITGVWQFKGSKVVAFSATTCIPIERFVNNCIGPLTILKFSSEYEVVNGVYPVLDGHVVPCGFHKNILLEVEKDLVKHCELKPLVVIHDTDQLEDLREIFKANKFRHFNGVAT